jgi:hypothetical protein
MEEGTKLRVVCLNVWGIPDIFTQAPGHIEKLGLGRLSKKERMQRIASRFSEFDVICLQEVWMKSDIEYFIQEANQQNLTHWRCFPSGRKLKVISTILRLNHQWGNSVNKHSSAFGVGSGMIILSRFPIEYSDFQLFSLCGKPQRLHHGTQDCSQVLK